MTNTNLNPENLSPITYRETRVITTDLLAAVYGAGSKNIHDNFANQADRFTEGKHFFRVDGDALRAFKNYPENFGVVDKRARHLILWTERGAARHAKMLDTDQAWEVFEKLEDAYFRQAGGPIAVQGDALTSRLDRLEGLITDLAHRAAPGQALVTTHASANEIAVERGAKQKGRHGLTVRIGNFLELACRDAGSMSCPAGTASGCSRARS